LKLSVWLMPGVADAPLLAAVIARYAQAFRAPTFPPHITMCTAALDAASVRADLAIELPTSLTFASVGFGSDYFHACYLRLRDDASVLALQARCAAALRGQVPEKYPPHLSLTYANLADEQREQATSLLPSLPLQAHFDRLETWDTTGAVSTWHRIDG
jgi:hypothetical protein